MNRVVPGRYTAPMAQAEPALRGALVLAVREWLDERHGAGSFSRALRAARLDWGVIRPEAWYPVAPLLLIVEQSRRDDETIEDLAAAFARGCAPTLIETLCGLPQRVRPTTLFADPDLLLRCLVNFGSIETSINLQGLFEGWVMGVPKNLEELFRGLWRGFAPELLHEAQVRDPRWKFLLGDRRGLAARLYVRCRYR